MGDGTKSKFYLDLSDTNDDRKRLKLDGQSPEVKKAPYNILEVRLFLERQKNVKTEMIDDIAQEKRKIKIYIIPKRKQYNIFIYKSGE